MTIEMSTDLNSYVDGMIDDGDTNTHTSDDGQQFDNSVNNQQQFEQQQQQQQDYNNRQQQQRNDDVDFDTQLRNEIELNRQQMDKPNTRGNQQQQQQQDQQRQQPQLRPLGDGTFSDARGNIVTEDGTVIAQGGFARRMYEKNQRSEAVIEQLRNDNQRLQLQSSEQNAISRAAQSYGLGTDELAQAVDFAGRVKRGDVISVAKDIVALAVAAGHNVTEILGSEVGDSIDMRALRTMLNQTMQPLQQQQETAQQQQQIQQNAQQRYTQFVTTHEFAQLHENNIAQIAQSHGVSAEQAYYALREFCVAHRLDFSQPIEAQLQARQQQQQGNPQMQQRGGRVPQINQQQQRRPLPNGQTSVHNTAGQPEMSHDASWSDIIKSSMAG